MAQNKQRKSKQYESKYKMGAFCGKTLYEVYEYPY